MYHVLGLALAVGGGYLVYKNRGRIAGFCKRFVSDDPEPKSEPPVPKRTFEVAAAREEFLRTSAFEGIYESIYRVAKGRSASAAEVVADWDARARNLGGSENLKNLWLSLFDNYESFSSEQLQKSANDFVEFIFDAGITRDGESHVTVDETTRYRYYAENDEFVMGETMKVRAACWTLGDKILEKGVLADE